MTAFDSTEQDAWAKRRSGRPWLCPEVRCTPLVNLRDGDYRDITVAEPGRSFFCWGAMTEPVTFTYDGIEHTNDANGCTYTPLKGLIRFQENAADWNALASYYRLAGDLFAELRAALSPTPMPPMPPTPSVPTKEGTPDKTDRTKRIGALLAADPEAFDWITAEGYALGWRAKEGTPDAPDE